MNETTEQTKDFYRLDIFLDGNGARPHRVVKSYSAGILLEAVWDEAEYKDYPETVWIIWKEFAGDYATRHLVSVKPNSYDSVDEIYSRLMKRIAEVGKPIPAPDNPPESWV